MAGNRNSGGTIAFKMSESELERAITSYKNGVEDGTIPAPCPSDWYAFIGYSTEEMRELMQFAGNAQSA